MGERLGHPPDDCGIHEIRCVEIYDATDCAHINLWGRLAACPTFLPPRCNVLARMATSRSPLPTPIRSYSEIPFPGAGALELLNSFAHVKPPPCGKCPSSDPCSPPRAHRRLARQPRLARSSRPSRRHRPGETESRRPVACRRG